MDSVLSYQAKLCAEREIQTDISCQNYQRGRVEEQDLIQLVLQLFELALKEQNMAGTQLKLHIRSVKNQLLIDFCCAYRRKKKVTEKQFSEWLRQYNGYMETTLDNGTLHIAILMENEQLSMQKVTKNLHIVQTSTQP